ncbi:unnamed protein product [Mytilus edulis]|uniref:Uncharacterized protein n=1 Tax=Mytilus edulis TaxID=6550 RepID=A0A8S3R369_MYTED|nr:unnamed protein product [Mytilus edulis]
MAEARPILSDVGLIPFFDVGNDINSLGQRWTRWLRSFNLYATGKGVVEAQQKKALLLHSAGMEVQDVYYTLVERDPGEHETVYEVAVEILNNHFTPQVNNSFQRNQFRAMEQKPQETIEQFITRLRQKAIYCNFANVDEGICDQVIDKCSSKRLRRKLLERHNVTLQQLRETAQAMEAAEKQATSIEQPIESVNKVSTYASKKQNQNKSEFKQISCYACGFSGHYKTDPKCPAKGKKCRLCQNEGHFEKCCKSKKNISKNHYSRKTNVRHVESADDTCSEPDYENEDDDYAFTVHGNQGKVSKFTVNVGGIDVPVVIDSGATVNIIDRTLWEHLKKNKIKCESKTSSKNLYAYGSNKPLTIAGSFNTNVCVNDRCVSADFFVIEEDGQALLGHKTSIELGVLKIETNVNTVTDSVVKTNYISKFPKVFSGIKPTTLRRYVHTDASDDAVQDVVKAVHKAAVQKTVKKNQKLDDFDKGVVRRTIYDLHKKSQSVTMPSLQQALKKKDIDVSISTVSRTVRLLGFRFYKNASSRRFVSEREDIVLLRMAYLRKIRKFRQQGRHIVYLDETWLNTNHVVKGDWLDVPSTSMSVFEPHCKGTHRKVPSGKGTRLIILDVGSSQQGLIPGCGLIFESKTNSSDYHDEMNKEHFTEWFRDTLLPKLPPRSVIIMDNAPYHSHLDPDSRVPNTNSNKSEISAWLEKSIVQYDKKMKKAELLDLVKQKSLNLGI